MVANASGLSPDAVMEEIATATNKPRKVQSWRDCLDGPLGEMWNRLPLEAKLVAFDFAKAADDKDMDRR